MDHMELTTTLNRISNGVYSIDQGMVRCFLILGTERALLLDTGAGECDLPGLIRTVTDLPLIGAGAAGLAAGSFLGLLIHDRIPADRFGRVIYAFVGIGGLWIIVSHLL